MHLKNLTNIKCPSCTNENTLRKSHARNHKEKLLKSISWFDIYRCKKCGWRGWRTNLYLNKRLIKRIIVYILLIVISALIVYNLLKLVV